MNTTYDFKLLCKTLTIVLALCIASISRADDYEEVSYEDLVHQLNMKKTKVSVVPQASVLDDINLHAGFGMLSSSMLVSEAQRNSQIQMNGFQLSFGIDLFSPNWIAEGVIANYGTGTSGSATYSFRELDMVVFYSSNPSVGQVGYRVGAGLANQYLTLSDLHSSIDESSPGSLLFGGLEGRLNNHLLLVGELNYRNSLLANSANRDAFGLSVKLDTSF